jgi:hypothetical protein
MNDNDSYHIILDPVDPWILEADLRAILAFLRSICDFVMADFTHLQYSYFLECPCRQLLRELLIYSLGRLAITTLDTGIKPLIFEHFK